MSPANTTDNTNTINETRTCEEGWLCLDDFNIGYISGDCFYSNVSFCRKGCYYNRCIDNPDLVILDIKVPKNISFGQKVKFFSVIQNAGSAPALAELPCESDDAKKSSFDTRWYIDGKQVAYWCHNAIMPNQINTEDISWVAQSGVHNITVIVDGADFVEESDENNNQRSVLVDVK